MLSIWKKIETWLTGPIDPITQHNMRVDLVSAMLVGFMLGANGFIPVVLRRLGASPTELAIFNMLFYIGIALSGVGMLLMRGMSPLTFSSLCWGLGRVSLFFIALVTNVPGFLVVTGFYSLFISLAGPAYSRLVTDMFAPEARGKVMALVRVGMALVMMLYTPLAGWILDTLGYRVLFPASAAIALISLIIFQKVKVSREPVPMESMETSRDTYNPFTYPRSFVIHLGALILLGLGGMIPFSIIPIIQVDQLKLSYTELGWLNLVMNLFWLVGYFLAGRLVDRWGAVRVVQLGALMNMLWLAPYLFASQGWMLLPAFVAAGFANACIDLGFFNAVLQLNPQNRVMQATSLQSLVIGARGLVSPFIGVGMLSLGASYATVLLVALGFSLSAVLVIFLIRTR